MTQRSLFWDGIVGDGGPYTQQHLHDFFFRVLLNGTGNRGVLRLWENELLVSGTSSPVNVAVGAAIVYGGYYETDEPVTVNIPTPSSGKSRYDRVVVRRNWSSQTTRIARVAGVAAAAPAIPALTQTQGAIYEVPLATVLITDAGNITITDTREFCTFSTEWPADTVDTSDYVTGAVTPAKVPDRTRYELKDAGQMEPDSGNPATWTVGGSYDYWSFADAATNIVWVCFMYPVSIVGATVALYVWSVPNVNGAGAGAETCKWDYTAYRIAEGAMSSLPGSITPDQQARVNTTIYRDTLNAAMPLVGSDLVLLKLSRDGVTDSYNSAMRLLGVEMSLTADS